MDSLTRVSCLANHSLDLDEMLPRTLAGIAELLPVDCLAVLRLDREKVEVRGAWTRPGADLEVRSRLFQSARGLSPVGSHRGSISGEARESQLPYLRGHRNAVRALLIPLVVDGACLGRFDLLRVENSTPFSPSESRFAEACAKILGLAMRNSIEYARVAWLAEHDPLTGIGNRRRFDVALDRELSRAQRYGRDLTLLLVDLDDFKEANTHLGLSGGDEILRRTARVFTSGARQGVDVPSRIGGDEFALILPEIDEAAAHELAQRLLKEVVKATAPLWPIRFSYSISTYPNTSAEDLRKSADYRLMDAKLQKRASIPPNLKLVQ